MPYMKIQQLDATFIPLFEQLHIIYSGIVF